MQYLLLTPILSYLPGYKYQFCLLFTYPFRSWNQLKRKSWRICWIHLSRRWSDADIFNN